MVKIKYVIIFSLFFLISCSPNSPEDFHAEGRALVRKLSDHLNQIESIEDLEKKQDVLRKSFNQIADLVIAARKYQLEHSEAEWIHEAIGEEQQGLIEQLRNIYAFPGGRQKIEELQREALLRLDAFESTYETQVGR